MEILNKYNFYCTKCGISYEKAPLHIYHITATILGGGNEPQNLQLDNFSREEIAERTGYQPTGGGFNNAISRLCILSLVEKTLEGIRFNQELLEV